jgi:hypothetical protein
LVIVTQRVPDAVKTRMMELFDARMNSTPTLLTGPR